MAELGMKLLFCFAIGTMASITVSFAQIDKCKPVQADVIFLLDSSGSMGQENFRQQLEFLAHFVDLMTTNHVTIGPHGLQVGVVSFANDAYIELYLNNHTDAGFLKEAIRNIRYKSGGTYTDEAFKKVPEMLTALRGGDRNYKGAALQRFVFLWSAIAVLSQ